MSRREGSIVVDAGGDGEVTDKTAADPFQSLYDQATQTIAAWCRDADQAARALLAKAEGARAQAEEDGERVREQARLEAGRILAAAETEAGQIRSEAQLVVAERNAEIESLRRRVDVMSDAVEKLLSALEDVMASVGKFAKPALGEEAPRPDGPAGPEASGEPGGS